MLRVIKMFNKYVWHTYLKAGGKDTVDIFASISNDDFSETAKNKFCGLIETLHSTYCPCKNIVDNAQSDLLQLFSDIESGDFLCGCYGLIGLSEDEEYSLDTLMELFYKGMEGNNLNEKTIFEELSMGMEYYSTFCYLMFPDVFVPYYFKYNFNVLEKIAIEFGIELPLVPAKKDYKARFFYYGELCNALYDFRIEHKLTPYELCAFLYDFAPKYIGGTDSYIIDELPEPKSAYFIGANKGDTFFNDDADIITPWQCSSYAEAGDIAVMYLRTPISAIDSIWKCVSDGFIDPFFYYYKCAYIAKPQKLKLCIMHCMDLAQEQKLIIIMDGKMMVCLPYQVLIKYVFFIRYVQLQEVNV